jgi:hypothetical protein
MGGKPSDLGRPVTEAEYVDAIDRFGEHDGRYGRAVVDCAEALRKGDFRSAFSRLVSYANSK